VPSPRAGRLDQIILNNQTVVALHQRLAHETPRRTGAGRFLVKPCLGIRSRNVGSIRTLLAVEVGLGVAVVVIGAGIGSVPGSVSVGGPIVSGDRGRRRIIRPLIVGPLALRLRLETFHQCTSFDQSTVGRKVPVGQQQRALALGQDRRHHLARHVRGRQPFPVLAEHSCDPS
jgi:hypothetical protein